MSEMCCKTCRRWAAGWCLAQQLGTSRDEVCNAWELSRVVEWEDENEKLQSRIAELEAENAELKERVAMVDVTAVFKSLGEMGYIEQVDKLNARIAELKEVIEMLIDQQREAKNHLIDKNLHIDSLYEEGYKLQQRIAELEAYIDKLIEVGDVVINAEPMWIAEEDKWETLVKDWKECKR